MGLCASVCADCWEQQEVIKRVHGALVRRGYRVWIDIEQMRGSTVDSMAL
eukprot:SAG11_NODE_42100_length_184_cov_996.317647_1_plen_49_part_10